MLHVSSKDLFELTQEATEGVAPDVHMLDDDSCRTVTTVPLTRKLSVSPVTQGAPKWLTAT